MIDPSHDPSLQSYLKQLGLNTLGYDLELDNWWGPKSESAYQDFLNSNSQRVIASTFADPLDVARFKLCKAQGKSDAECFKVGDNGIGAWGDDTTTNSPQCALPPEVIIPRWTTLSNGHNKIVIVNYQDATSHCRLTDLMPRIPNIPTNARIDLNPGAVKELGIPKGGMVEVTWRWA